MDSGISRGIRTHCIPPIPTAQSCSAICTSGSMQPPRQVSNHKCLSTPSAVTVMGFVPVVSRICNVLCQIHPSIDTDSVVALYFRMSPGRSLDEVY
jgi:hypothetical protein